MIRNTLHLIVSICFMIFVVIIAITPFRVLYIFSDFVAWLLRCVFRYRVKVVIENLDCSDLNLTPEQKKAIIRKIYKNLSDLLLESFKSFSMSRASVRKRHKVLNPEIAEPYYNNGQSLILATGHLGNWEWGSLSAAIQTPFRILGFYKPLKNKFINRLIHMSRARFGTILVPIRETSQGFTNYQEIPTVFLMAADQNPRRVEQAFWVRFMGRETAFLHGLEKYAPTHQLPIIFASINRVKRGRYKLELSVLTENPSHHEPGEITQMYAQKLESAIREHPENWLWTHRRWKHKPTGT
jgi:Kdo2-lipid IVA lauroyltransferase/acyltransferase